MVISDVLYVCVCMRVCLFVDWKQASKQCFVPQFYQRSVELRQTELKTKKILIVHTVWWIICFQVKRFTFEMALILLECFLFSVNFSFLFEI